LGVPVICFDHCGQGDTVTSECGVKIHVGTFEDACRDFSAAILDVASKPEYWNRLARNAKQKSADLTWDSKAVKMSHIYDLAIEHYRAEHSDRSSLAQYLSAG
jgi:glycosyltransferase involved in cell wall biosynthesis